MINFSCSRVCLSQLPQALSISKASSRAIFSPWDDDQTLTAKLKKPLKGKKKWKAHSWALSITVNSAPMGAGHSTQVSSLQLSSPGLWGEKKPICWPNEQYQTVNSRWWKNTGENNLEGEGGIDITLPTLSKALQNKQPNVQGRKKLFLRQTNTYSSKCREQIPWATGGTSKTCKAPVPSDPGISQEIISEWRESENFPSPRILRYTTVSHH